MENIPTFLGKVVIPKIVEGHKQSLDQLISTQEVEWAIAKLNLGKAPGLDGFYKTFQDQLVPYLKELFDFCIKVGKIPATGKESRLMLILKKGRS